MDRANTGRAHTEALVGIDCGSSFCKGAFLRDGAVRALVCRPTGWNMAESGRLVGEELAAQVRVALARGAAMAATGYGREKIAGAGRVVTEISAHARGADFLRPGVRTVIDIGGQDCKVIVVEGGRVQDFQMNDKCAAGSGRFLQMVAGRLDVDAAGMEALLAAGTRVPLNSTCVVFAESEIIGLLAEGVSREEIAGGAADSLARRIAALAGRIPLRAPVVLSGGLSESPGLRAALSSLLGVELVPLPHGLYAGAIGAALAAAPQGPPSGPAC